MGRHSQKAPQGFPLSPDKWSVMVTSSTNYTGSATTNWQYAGTSISLPIGVWNTMYKFTANMEGSSNNVCIVWGSLSTTNNSSIDDFACYQVGNNQSSLGINAYGSGVITNLSKTTYYATYRSMHGQGNVGMVIKNLDSPLLIKAVCSYL